MKLQFAIVLGVILVGSIATVNWAFLQEDDASVNALKGSAGMLGHVTLTAIDEDGNIIAYRQSDNLIVNSGDNCIAENLFGVNFSCAAPTGAYTTVLIGTATAVHLETETGLGATHFTTTGATVGTPTTAIGTSGAFVTITAAFLDVSADIGEAALRNSANTQAGVGDTLALNNFAAISLGATDDLTIDWTITVDG